MIVNLTDLTEGTKKKSDRYWPDENKKILELDNGVKLEHLSQTSYQGTYYHRYYSIFLWFLRILFSSRIIAITTPDGKCDQVHQIQTIRWVDLSAPDDTKILRDLVQKTRDLNEAMRGYIVLVANQQITLKPQIRLWFTAVRVLAGRALSSQFTS